MKLGSCVAVAVAQAGGCSSDSTPSLGTSMCCRCGPKKQTNKQTNKTLLSCTLDVELNNYTNIAQYNLQGCDEDKGQCV